MADLHFLSPEDKSVLETVIQVMKAQGLIPQELPELPGLENMRAMPRERSRQRPSA